MSKRYQSTLSNHPVSVRSDAEDPHVPQVVLGRLYAEYGALVFGVCLSHLKDSSEAEDAAQEVFLSAYTALIRGSEPRSPAAWLATIARRECLKRRRSQIDPPLSLEDRDSPSADALSEVLRSFDCAAVQEAISDLPTSQRRAFVLRELIGLPYAEIARLLAITDAAVESLLVRARRGLRERLEGSLGSLGAIVPLVLRRLLSPLSQTPPFMGAGQLGVGPLAGQAAAGIAVGVTLLAGGAVIVEHTVAAPDRGTPPRVWRAAPSAPGSAFRGAVSDEERAPGSPPSIAGLLLEPADLTLESPLAATEPAGIAQEQAPSEGRTSTAAPANAQGGPPSGIDAHQNVAQAAASEAREPTPTGPGNASDDDLELDEEPDVEERDDESAEAGEDPPAEGVDDPPEQDEEAAAAAEEEEEEAREDDEEPDQGQEPEEDSDTDDGDNPLPSPETEPSVTPSDDFAADPGSDESSSEPSDEDAEDADSDT